MPSDDIMNDVKKEHSRWDQAHYERLKAKNPSMSNTRELAVFLVLKSKRPDVYRKGDCHFSSIPNFVFIRHANRLTSRRWLAAAEDKAAVSAQEPTPPEATSRNGI